MVVAGKYSFNNGEATVLAKYPQLLTEIEQVITAVDAEQYKTKESEEKTMPGQLLYSPGLLNKAFKKEFSELGWINWKVKCQYPTNYYTEDYKPRPTVKGAFREIDFKKEQLGVEVQFGKYAFLLWFITSAPK